MTEELQQILVLLVFSLVFLLMNLKAGASWFKWFTYIALLASLIGAAIMLLRWMFL